MNTILKRQTIKVLKDLEFFLLQLNDEGYQRKIEVLSDNSIGSHIRHILEFYTCLIAGIRSGKLNYDDRKRDLQLEMFVVKALEESTNLTAFVDQMDTVVPLQLSYSYSGLDDSPQGSISSNSDREFMYALEHMVHHLAILKVALKSTGITIVFPNDFGVAASTIRNMNAKCVQ